MQFRCAVIMRIATGQHTAPAGAALATGEIRVIEAHPACRQAVDIRGTYVRVAITTKVIHADVICNEQKQVGPFRWRGKGSGLPR